MSGTKPKAFASRKRDAEWKGGLRSYLEYRDLGMNEATNGRVLAHVLRAKGPCDGPGGYHSHSLDFQMIYLLKGWVRVDFEGVGELRIEAGDAWYQPPDVKHEVLEYSDDFELIEITMPADFPTRDEARG